MRELGMAQERPHRRRRELHDDGVQRPGDRDRQQRPRDAHEGRPREHGDQHQQGIELHRAPDGQRVEHVVLHLLVGEHDRHHDDAGHHRVGEGEQCRRHDADEAPDDRQDVDDPRPHRQRRDEGDPHHREGEGGHQAVEDGQRQHADRVAADHAGGGLADRPNRFLPVRGDPGQECPDQGRALDQHEDGEDDDDRHLERRRGGRAHHTHDLRRQLREGLRDGRNRLAELFLEMEAFGEGANRSLALLGLPEVLRRLLGELHPLGGDGSRHGSADTDEDQEEDGSDGEDRGAPAHADPLQPEDRRVEHQRDEGGEDEVEDHLVQPVQESEAGNARDGEPDRREDHAVGDPAPAGRGSGLDRHRSFPALPAGAPGPVHGSSRLTDLFTLPGSGSPSRHPIPTLRLHTAVPGGCPRNGACSIAMT